MPKPVTKIKKSCFVCLAPLELYSYQVKEKNFCSHSCMYDYRRKIAEDPMEKWLSQVDKTPGQGPNGDCWIWTGQTKRGNYGVFYWPLLRVMGAHIASYCLHTGDMSTSGFAICHHCDNPPCVNPAHLFKGTHSDNVQDAMEKGRMALGDKNPNAKLTDEEAAEIKRRKANGEKTSVLMVEFGVSKPTIDRVARGYSFSHLP